MERKSKSDSLGARSRLRSDSAEAANEKEATRPLAEFGAVAAAVAMVVVGVVVVTIAEAVVALGAVVQRGMGGLSGSTEGCLSGPVWPQ